MFGTCAVEAVKLCISLFLLLANLYFPGGHFLLQISLQIWNFPQVFSSLISNCVLIFLWIPWSYRPFSRWDMIFYVLSWRIFDYDFKNNEATSFIVSGLFFHMSINVAAKFFFISWILLKKVSLTAVPNTRFHGNVLTFALFWCTILYSDWLKW